MDRRKELKLQYKITPRPKGVFQIRNIVNGKLFVSSSPDLDKIYNRHQFQLKCGVHKSRALQEDWNAFGEENFIFEVLERLKPAAEPGRNDREELEKMEQRWLEQLQPYGERGYNTMTN